MSSKDVKLTERDMQLLGIAMRNATAKPDIDYDTFAAQANLKDARSARVCFQSVWKKISDGATNEENADGEGGGKKKATPRKRKGEAEPDGDGETPTKKKATPRESKKDTLVKAEPDAEVDGEEESSTKKKATPRKDKKETAVKAEPAAEGGDGEGEEGGDDF